MRNTTTTLLAAAAMAGLTLPGLAQQDTAGAAGNTAAGAGAAGAAGGAGMTGSAGGAGMTGGATGGMNAGMSGTLSAADKLFVVRAADGNMAEVMTSQMALKKAGNGETKQIATQMIQEHGQAQAELTQLAQQKGVTLPPTVGPTHQIISKALGTMSGSRFDQAYLGAQVDDHENTIALFQQEIAAGQDPDVKAYAAKYLPKIVGHTAMIYGAASGVGVMAMKFRPSTPPAGMTMSPGDVLPGGGQVPVIVNTTGGTAPGAGMGAGTTPTPAQ